MSHHLNTNGHYMWWATGLWEYRAIKTLFCLFNSVNYTHFSHWSAIYQWKARILTFPKNIIFLGCSWLFYQCISKCGPKITKFFSPLLSKSHGPSHICREKISHCTCANFHAHMNPISKVQVINNGLMWVVSLKKLHTHIHMWTLQKCFVWKAVWQVLKADILVKGVHKNYPRSIFLIAITTLK